MAKVEKTPYLSNGQPKLTELPTDFDHKTNKPLTKEDFAHDSLYCFWQAKRAQDKADRWTKQGEDLKKYGSAKERKAAESLKRLQKQLDDKKAALIEALGEDAVAEMMEQAAE